MKNCQRALADAVQLRWKRYRRALQTCQRKFSEPSIHDSRIAARWLSAQLDLLRLFASREEIEKAQRALKRHLDTFDPLRDAHVQLLLLKELPKTDGVKTIQKLTKRRERRYRDASSKRIRRVKVRPIKNTIKLLVARLRADSRHADRMRDDRRRITRCVDAAFARVVALRRRMDGNDVRTIHRERVAFKRFRYMMESMRLLYPEIQSRHLAGMRAFQSMLGDLQDTEVFLKRVDKMLRKEQIGDEAIPIRNWLARRRKAQAARCLRHADVVFQFWPVKTGKGLMESQS